MLLETGLSCYEHRKAGTAKEVNLFIPRGRTTLMVFCGFYTYLRIFNFTGKRSRQLLRIWEVERLLSSLLTSWLPFQVLLCKWYQLLPQKKDSKNAHFQMRLYPQAFLCWPSLLSDSTAVSVKVFFTSKLFKNEHSGTEVWSTCVKDEAGAETC